jgi:hypothetical protein
MGSNGSGEGQGAGVFRPGSAEATMFGRHLTKGSKQDEAFVEQGAMLTECDFVPGRTLELQRLPGHAIRASLSFVQSPS